MAKRGPKASGKQNFVADFLHKNPAANEKAIKEAWTASGHEGTVSSSMIYKVKSSLGLPRLPRGPRKAIAKHAAPRTREAAPRVESRKSSSVDEIEAALDRAIYKAMEHGNLSDVESALRRARRLLIKSSHS